MLHIIQVVLAFGLGIIIGGLACWVYLEIIGRLK